MYNSKILSIENNVFFWIISNCKFLIISLLQQMSNVYKNHNILIPITINPLKIWERSIETIYMI